VKVDGQPLVIDTKWKILTDNQPSMQDLRQMFAYNHFWDAPKSILLYPKVSDKVHDVNGDYVANQVHTAGDALMNHSCSLAFVELLEGFKVGEGFRWCEIAR